MVDGMIASLLGADVSLSLHFVVFSFLHFILRSLLPHKSLIFCTGSTEFQQAPSVQIYQQGQMAFRCISAVIEIDEEIEVCDMKMRCYRL